MRKRIRARKANCRRYPDKKAHVDEQDKRVHVAEKLLSVLRKIARNNNNGRNLSTLKVNVDRKAVEHVEAMTLHLELSVLFRS